MLEFLIKRIILLTPSFFIISIMLVGMIKLMPRHPMLLMVHPNLPSGAQRPKVSQFYWWRWNLLAPAVLLTSQSVKLAGNGLFETMDSR